MPDPATRFDHVAITVQDMERSVAFYRDLLGFEMLGQLFLDEGTVKLVYLRSGDACVELFEYRDQDAATAVGVGVSRPGCSIAGSMALPAAPRSGTVGAATDDGS